MSQKDDLISRQAAIDAISCNITITGRQNAELVAATIGSFADRIKALPTAQPERKKGKWIPKNDRWHCSLCDGIAPKGIRWEFCPNCGADMRGADEP